VVPGTDGGPTVDIDRWVGIIGEQTVRARGTGSDRGWATRARLSISLSSPPSRSRRPAPSSFRHC